MVGDPKIELLRKAKEIKADVVLMGARKMGAIKRYIKEKQHKVIQGRPLTAVIFFFFLEPSWVASVIILYTTVLVLSLLPNQRKLDTHKKDASPLFH